MACSACEKKRRERHAQTNIQKDDSPSWAKILRNFSQSMIKWMREGTPTVSSQVHMQRYSICQQCEQFGKYQCAKCGCICYVKTKLETEKCPLEKW